MGSTETFTKVNILVFTLFLEIYIFSRKRENRFLFRRYGNYLTLVETLVTKTIVVILQSE